MQRFPASVLTPLSLLLSFIASGHCVAKNTFSLSTGYHIIEGDYDHATQSTTHYWPLTLHWRNFPWQAKLTVPYLKVRAEEDLFLFNAELNNPQTEPSSPSQSVHASLGDVISQLSYSQDWPVGATQMLYLDYSLKIKWGTADPKKGLGTAKNDYRLRLDAFQVWGDWQYFAHIGYQHRSQSTSIAVQNGLNGSLGISYVLPYKRERSKSLSVGAVLDIAQAQTDSTEGRREIALFSRWKLSAHWRLSAYTLVGFSSGSPDHGLGGQISYRF